jgi:tetratricopeptide (TPR) repeat protein
MAASKEGERKALLKAAYGDTQYSLVRIDQTNVLYAPMSVQMGLVARAQGNWARAMQHFDAAIAARPDLPDGYQGVAMIHRDRRDLEAARDVLVRGNDAVGGSSAEIHYTLGLVLFDMKQYELAAEHARRAYALGYPLPGLRRKLAAAGVAVD